IRHSLASLSFRFSAPYATARAKNTITISALLPHNRTTDAYHLRLQRGSAFDYVYTCYMSRHDDPLAGLADMNDAVLAFDAIRQEFPTPGADAIIRVIDGISFEVGTGKFVAVIGPSACGKSTLLQMAPGLLMPTRRGARRRRARGGRPEQFRTIFSGPIVRRDAKARLDRPHSGVPARRDLDGRTIRRARRADTDGDAGRFANAVTRRRCNRSLHPPRHHRSRAVGRQCRDHEPASFAAFGQHRDRPAAAARCVRAVSQSRL